MKYEGLWLLVATIIAIHGMIDTSTPLLHYFSGMIFIAFYFMSRICRILESMEKRRGL